MQFPRTLLKPACLAIGLIASPFVQAGEINSINLLDQSEFRQLSEDLGAALSYKSMIPSEALGVTGIDLGFGVTGTRLGNKSVWTKAAGGSAPDSLVAVPTVRLHKGLPFNVDIGVSAAAVPSSNVKAYGGELRWAVVPGGTLTPAFALRASMTALNGVDQLSLRTLGLDASVSKGFAMFTPYAGIGTVRVKSTPGASTGLAKESFYQSKVFVGANFNLGLANLAAEADRTGDATSVGLKLGFRF